MVFSVYVIVLGTLVLLGQGLCRRLRAASAALEPARSPEPVTVIKPVKGVTDHTREDFLSWLNQEYDAEVQILFCLQDAGDPALELLAGLERESTRHRFEVVVSPVRPGFHGKTSNLFSGLQRARHPLLVFSDADVRAPDGALRRLVGAHQKQGGIVSCPVAHVGAANLWARCFALIWNWCIYHVFAPGLLHSLGIASVVGGTVILRRDTFERLGGIEAIAGYAGDDVALAQAARRHGIRRGYGPELLSVVGRLSFIQVLHKYRRLTAGSRQVGLWPAGPFLIMLGIAYPWMMMLLSVVRARPLLMIAGIGFLGIRSLHAGWVARIAGEPSGPTWTFIPFDVVCLLAAATTLFDTRFEWGGQRLRIARGGKVQVLS